MGELARRYARVVDCARVRRRRTEAARSVRWCLDLHKAFRGGRRSWPLQPATPPSTPTRPTVATLRTRVGRRREDFGARDRRAFMSVNGRGAWRCPPNQLGDASTAAPSSLGSIGMRSSAGARLAAVVADSGCSIASTTGDTQQLSARVPRNANPAWCPCRPQLGQLAS